MSKLSNAFESSIERSLTDAGLKFMTNVSSSGISPDFLIEGQDGRLIVIEAKSSADPNSWARYSHQAKLFETALGADRAFIVVNTPHAPSYSPNIISAKDMIMKIREALDEPTIPKKAMIVQETEATIFAAMPFAPEYDDVFYVAMSSAAQAVNAKCYRVDKEHFTGEIVPHIKESIEKSIAVIGDISEAKPNVMYEVGYAHALRKPTVHISSTPLVELPFDVSGWNTIPYAKGQTTTLCQPLSDRLKAVLR
jgi:hypothetical protein